VKSVSLVFSSFEEFWIHCFFSCKKFRIGCAEVCELRKRLGIPPFGGSYFGKFEGKVAV